MRKYISCFLISLFLVLMVAGCNSQHGGPNDTADISLTTNSVEASNVSGIMKVHFIDIGQGDSTLIQTPKENILIDGGDIDANNILPGYLKEQGVKKIDILISTHPHADHIGGLQSVLAQIPVSMVIDPIVDKSKSGLYSGYKKVIAQKGIELKRAVAGDVYKISGGTLKIIFCDNKAEKTNDTSIVALITYGKSRVLFTGDLEKDKEHEVVKNGSDIAAEVLQVGHHGSHTSSCDEFIRAVSPKWAVISCGSDNDYGHPHKETLQTMKKYGVQVFRTDKDGDIVMTTNGKTWSRGNVSLNSKKEEKEDKPVSGNNAVQSDNKNEPAIYVGNKKSMVYHAADCGSMPSEKNRVQLLSKADAERQGYKPHKCVE